MSYFPLEAFENRSVRPNSVRLVDGLLFIYPIVFYFCNHCEINDNGSVPTINNLLLLQ